MTTFAARKRWLGTTEPVASDRLGLSSQRAMTVFIVATARLNCARAAPRLFAQQSPPSSEKAKQTEALVNKAAALDDSPGIHLDYSVGNVEIAVIMGNYNQRLSPLLHVRQQLLIEDPPK